MSTFPLDVRREDIHGAFTKFNINPTNEAPWPFYPVIHHFRAPDLSDPHDHPFAFRSYILRGSYVEEVYHVAPDGSWQTERVHRPEGTSHFVPATHIHRIVELPEGECWTMILTGHHEREWRIWQFGDRVLSRAWHEAAFG